MRKMILIVLALVAGAANADVSTLGCSILSDIVYRQVAGAGPNNWLVAAAPGVRVPPIECGDTARAVSKGFTRAMAEKNLYLVWPTLERQRGDVCNSHFLSECYPERDPFVPYFPLYDAETVMRKWRTVQATVTASMPAGAASNVSRFDPVSVGRDLRRNLGTTSRELRRID